MDGSVQNDGARDGSVQNRVRGGFAQNDRVRDGLAQNEKGFEINCHFPEKTPVYSPSVILREGRDSARSRRIHAAPIQKLDSATPPDGSAQNDEVRDGYAQNDGVREHPL
jgi:hypothetical protein